MKESNLPKADLVTAIFSNLASIVIVTMSLRMPRMQEVGAPTYSAPGLVPGLLGVMLFGLSLILLVRSILKRGYQMGITQSSLKAFCEDKATFRVFVTLLISGLYGMVLLGNLPYVLATFIYVLGFVLIFEYRLAEPLQTQVKTVVWAVVLAVLVTGCVAAVFRYLFLVRLP